MLPLMQTRQMVQTPLEPPGPLHMHGKQEYILNYQRSRVSPPSPHNVGSTPRSFAIPAAQQHRPLHRITASFTTSHPHDHRVEHSLRRKTPSGTIDNGYDGSHLVSGPPPLKQTILSVSSDIFPTAVANSAPAISGGNVPYPLQLGNWLHPAAGKVNHGVQCLNLPPALPRGWSLGLPNMSRDPGGADGGLRLPMMPQHNYQTASSLSALMGPGYQQPLAPPVFSPAGYAQPGGWGDAGLSDYQTAVPLANGYTPQNAVVDSAFMPTQATIHHGLPNAMGLGHAQPFGLPLPSRPIDDGFSRYGQSHTAYHAPLHSLQALSLSSAVANPSKGANGQPSPTRFKERALQYAHQAYSDLLLYLGHAKRVQHARNGSNSRPSNKMVVFPKPPKTNIVGEGQAKARPPTYAEATASYSQHLAQKEMASRTTGLQGHLTDPHNLVTGNVHDRAAVGNPIIAAEILHNAKAQMAQYASKPHLGYQERGSPLLNAKACLEMLSTLCEQSGWKWVDGILLGGCLHYGLEHYEEALEWFRRIVNLDER